MASYSATLDLTGETTLSVAVPAPRPSSPISETLSGIVVNQNQYANDDNHYVDLTTGSWVYQEFLLPDNYPRGTDDPNLTTDRYTAVKVPPLTGLQVFVSVAEDMEDIASLDWKLEYYVPSTGWVGAAKGQSFGAASSSANETADNGVWVSAYFDPYDVDDKWRYRWRFAIRGRSATGVHNEPVDEYDGTHVTIGGAKIRVVPDISEGPLQPGRPYPFDLAGTPALLSVIPGSDEVVYSIQQGATKVWYASPNPLELQGRCRAFAADGVTEIKDGSETVSLRFRVLAGVADEGVDFLGNSYRSVLVRNRNRNVASGSVDRFWLSKPNPSRFAVESLYFDLRNGDDAVVVDQLLLDPVTPGVWFHVYYSNDPIPGTDEKSWDNLLWERVPSTFLAARKDRHTLPRPITAKYVKIEFTHLQARYYSTGDFQIPVQYKKHPKWVFDYFMQVYAQQMNAAKYVKNVSYLEYDMMQLAYNYFLDDIRNQFASFEVSEDATDAALVNQFNATQPSLDNLVDPDTAFKIRTLFRPFLRQPFNLGKAGNVLFDYGFQTSAEEYSKERVIRQRAYTDEVTSLDREQVVVEKNYPVMSFPIQCRHKYRLTSAAYDQDLAYYAGVKEIAFLRDHYASRHDHSAYIESAGDNINVERNDFELVDFNWVTHATS